MSMDVEQLTAFIDQQLIAVRAAMLRDEPETEPGEHRRRLDQLLDARADPPAFLEFLDIVAPTGLTSDPPSA